MNYVTNEMVLTSNICLIPFCGFLATCPSACHPNATCVGTTCTCKNGFIGDGVNTCSG